MEEFKRQSLAEIFAAFDITKLANMSLGQWLFFGGLALFAVTLLMGIFFLIFRPKYRPENAAVLAPGERQTARLRNGYPTDSMTARQAQSPSRQMRVEQQSVPDMSQAQRRNTALQSLLETAPLPQNAVPTAPLPQNAEPTAPLPQDAEPTAPLPQDAEPTAPLPQDAEPTAPLPQNAEPTAPLPQNAEPTVPLNPAHPE